MRAAIRTLAFATIAAVAGLMFGCSNDDTQSRPTGPGSDQQPDSHDTIVPDVWTTRLSGSKIDIEKVVWTGHQYVAVGNVGANGTALVSDDGLSWDSVPVTGTKWLSSVASSGEMLVAVSWYGEIVSSEDGLTWTKQIPRSAGPLLSVIWAGTQFATVGGYGSPFEGFVQTSLDGALWNHKQVCSPHSLRDIVWADGKFVAVGQSGTTITSTDGVTWSHRHVNGATEIYAVAYGAGRFVAVGHEKGIVSTDGLAWQTVNIPEVGSGYIRDIVWSGSKFVAVGDGETLGSGGIWTSADGLTWQTSLKLPSTRLCGITWSSEHKMFASVGVNGAVITYKESK